MRVRFRFESSLFLIPAVKGERSLTSELLPRYDRPMFNPAFKYERRNMPEPVETVSTSSTEQIIVSVVPEVDRYHDCKHAEYKVGDDLKRQRGFPHKPIALSKPLPGASADFRPSQSTPNMLGGKREWRSVETNVNTPCSAGRLWQTVLDQSQWTQSEESLQER